MVFFVGGSLLEPRDSDSIADLLKSANAKWTFDDEEGQLVEKTWASVKYSPPRLSYNESSSKHAITVAAAKKEFRPQIAALHCEHVLLEVNFLATLNLKP